jgi:hypothetical protein
LSVSSSGIAEPPLRERAFDCGTFTEAKAPPPSRSK